MPLKEITSDNIPTLSQLFTIIQEANKNWAVMDNGSIQYDYMKDALLPLLNQYGVCFCIKFTGKESPAWAEEAQKIHESLTPNDVHPKFDPGAPVSKTWLSYFEKEFEDRLMEEMARMENLIWRPRLTFEQFEKSTQKQQQHMTLLSIKDPQLIDKVESALRVADEKFDKSQPRYYYVRDLLLPLLQARGIDFCINTPSNGTSEPQMSKESIMSYPKTPKESIGMSETTTQDHMRKYDSELSAQLAPGQSIGEVAGKMKEHIQQEFSRYTDHGIQDFTKKAPVAVFGIGTAVILAKYGGKKISRKGWNGKDMFVYYVPAGNWPAITPTAKQVFGETVPYNHYLAIKNVDGTVSTWAPSGSDTLAEDFYVVD